jgi:CMP-N-acetylneuraminic acid synthetase
MKNKAICISTVRKNSKSVKNKNIMQVHGKPLFMHNIDYASNSKFISSVHITTDININKKILTKKKIGYIKRPRELCTDKASHFLTIKHAMKNIEKQGIEFDIVVVILGNSFGAKTKDLDEGLKKLINNKKLDSVISVAKYNMYNPIRAYKKHKKTLLTNFFETKTIEKKIKNLSNINTKDAFDDIYFFNGSFWIIRKEVFLKNSGLPPFRYLGRNIGFIEQDPKFLEIDDKWQKKLFK